MSDEKDRFGDKLKDLERGREEHYFAEQERQLLERMRAQKAQTQEAQLRGAMMTRCPECGEVLGQEEIEGVFVDACPAGHGLWMKRVELQKISTHEDGNWLARWLRT